MVRKRLFRHATSYDRFRPRSGSHNTLWSSPIEGCLALGRPRAARLDRRACLAVSHTMTIRARSSRAWVNATVRLSAASGIMIVTVGEVPPRSARGAGRSSKLRPSWGLKQTQVDMAAGRNTGGRQRGTLCGLLRCLLRMGWLRITYRRSLAARNTRPATAPSGRRPK